MNLLHFDNGLSVSGRIFRVIHAASILAFALFSLGCSDDDVPKNTAAPIDVVPLEFRDETLQRGLAFSHLQGEESLTGIHETLGAGACAFDYDNDGWTDLFLVNGSGLTRFYGQHHWWNLPRGHVLFRNEGGSFRDVTAEAGLDFIDWGMGCTSADIDNDGHRDLFIANYGRNRLLKNNGDGTFTDKSMTAGLDEAAWSTGAAVADYDGDRHADIYVVNYVDFEPGARTFEGAQQFRTEMARAFDPSLFPSISNRLYRNRGDWTFEDVTDETGVADTGGRGLMAQWLDIDDDARPDLLIANDAGSPLGLYLNRVGRFVAAGEQYRLNTAAGVRGIAVDDINGDGALDLAIGTADGRPPVMLMQQTEMAAAEVFEDTGWQLFSNARRTAIASTYGVLIEDFNNDGLPDAFLANGYTGADQDVPRLPQGQRASLFVNANGKMIESNGIDDPGVHSARTAIAADFNNDGLTDIYIANNNDIGRLLINRTTTSSSFLSLELAETNPPAGATLTVSSDVRRRARLGEAMTLFGSSGERVHFGTGSAEHVDIHIKWPNGKEDRFRNVAVNAHYSIDRSGIRQSAFPQATEQDVVFPLAIGANRPANRAEYLGWRLEAGDASERERLFRIAMDDPSSQVRLFALEIARATPRQEWLTSVLSALEHSEPETRIAALAALEKYEAESTVRWILSSLEDSDAGVRIRAAEVFRAWFAEDEAVIQRKFLALPALIRLLDDPTETVQFAAIRALGEAERYRAITPLENRLKNGSREIRAAAAWALGRIRERGASAPLRERMLDENENASVRAAAVIALQRLGETRSLEKLITTSEPGVLLDVVAALLALPDRVVIARDRISTALESVLNDERFDRTDKSAASTFIAAVTYNGADTGLLLLEPFLKHQLPVIRALAWQSAFAIAPSQSKTLWQRAQQDTEPSVRIAAFHRYIETAEEVSSRELLKAEKDSALREHAQKQLLKHRHLPTAQALLVEALESGTSPRRKEQIVSLLALSGMKVAVPSELLSSVHDGIRAEALRLEVSGLPQYVSSEHPPAFIVAAAADAALSVRRAVIDALAPRHEAWATEFLSRLMKESGDIALQRHIVDNAWRRPGHAGLDLLDTVLKIPGHPLAPPAVVSLSKIDSPESRKLLRDVLADPAYGDDLRFSTARALWKEHDADVRSLIEKETDR